MTTDNVLNTWLERQQAEALALAAESDILDLIPLGPAPARRYVAEFYCHGLIYRDGAIMDWDRFLVGVRFPADYLSHDVDVRSVVTLLEPRDVFSPHIRGAAICLGLMPLGTSLVDILYQTYAILAWQKSYPVETDALNFAACVWQRNNPQRLPTDPRPLKRPSLRPPVRQSNVRQVP